MTVAPELEFLPLFPNQTEVAIYQRLTEWANEGLTPSSARWVDTREGSIFWTLMRPLSRELATLYDRAGSEVPAAAHPLFSWSSYLDDLASVYGLSRLIATPSAGIVRFFGTGGETVAGGTTVGVPPTGEDAPQPTFTVTVGGAVPAAITTPVGFGVTPVAGGGTFAAGTYHWKLTALGGAGETLPTADGSGVIALNGHANLAWTAVAGATGYKVYRSTATDGQNVSPALIATVGAVTAYTDTGTAAAAGAVPAVNTTASVDLAVMATDSGVIGNVGAGAITEAITPLAPTVTLSNPAAIVGGTETESDASLRNRLLESFRSKGAGTRGDYRRWALGFPGVGRATVIPVWNGPGTVKVIVTTEDGQPVSPTVVSDLQDYLDPTPGLGAGIAPIGHIVTVVTATALTVNIAADIALDDAYTLDGTLGTVALRTAMETALDLYLQTIEPGSYIILSQIIGRLVEVTGVLDVDPASVLINGVNANVLMDDDPAQVPLLGTFTPTVI